VAGGAEVLGVARGQRQGRHVGALPDLQRHDRTQHAGAPRARLPLQEQDSRQEGGRQGQEGPGPAQRDGRGLRCARGGEGPGPA